MELLPIIEQALTVFTIFSVVTLTISYILYKMKQKEKQKSLETKPVSVQVPVAQFVPPPVQQATYQEQSFQIDQRKMQLQEVERVQAIKSRDRFQVVNAQQSDLRVAAAVTLSNQPFYHPRASENRKQIMGRKSFNLFDNYSNGGEKLEKLNLSVNV